MSTQAMQTRRVSRGAHSFQVAIDEPTYAAFWDGFDNGTWEPQSLANFDAGLTPNSTLVDIGSWIGPTVLYAAASGVKRVIAVEADPIALKHLRANIALNPELANRITVIDRAISNIPGTVKFGSRDDGGDSMSSLIHENMTTAWEVETISPAELSQRYADDENVFLKIDIEGGEYLIVPEGGELLTPNVTHVLLSTHPKFAIGDVKGIRRGKKWLELAGTTRRMFGHFRGWRLARTHRRSTRRHYAVEGMQRFGMLYWPLRGTWVITRASG